MAPESKTYKDAIRCLNTLQSTPAEIRNRKAGRSDDLSQSDAMEKMEKWLEQIGYKPTDLDSLNVVHVAGTKGKGSTCKYVNGLLMERYQARLDEVKIGLYTSPHLCHVRERIRINSRPIEETVFTSRFFEIWHKLGLENDSKGSSGSRPGYFRFLTLLAFHVFKSYGVNIAIVEVGVGGKFDSTNIVPNPKVVAITNIHLDHQNQLGKTIEEIAWHKAGIMKTSAPAFTVPQKSAVQAVLSSRAAESNVALESITKQSWINILEDHMALNAALAVRVVGELFKLLRSPELSNDRDRLPMEREELSRGLAKTCLPARHEVVDFRESQWYLDGAHTKESVESAVLWFAGKVSHSNDTNKVVLIFAQERREPLKLLNAISECFGEHSIKPDLVVFCSCEVDPEDTARTDCVRVAIEETELQLLSAPKECKRLWLESNPGSESIVTRYVTGAMDYIDTMAPAMVFAVGSMYLAGAIYAHMKLEAEVYREEGVEV